MKCRGYLLLVTIAACIILALIFRNITEIQWVTKEPKFILMWNGRKEIPHSVANFDLASCPFKCEIISNISALAFEKYDAVVINGIEVSSSLPEANGYKRSGHQRFIFLTRQSPKEMPLTSKYSNYFNWTMSYRLDSDILFRHGRVVPKASAPINKSEIIDLIETFHPARNYAKSKTKTAVWISHEANSRNEKYIKELSKFIDVDIIRHLSHSKHHLQQLNRYKFYLSFEDSVCHDYVSETFFNILKQNIIPVVYGGANYCVLAPAHSYIEAMSFTPKQLASYLKELASSDRLYNQFFWWKRFYNVESGSQMASRAFCDLCSKLHQDSAVKMHKELPWNPRTQCK